MGDRTIHVKKLVWKVQFKKRAKRAISGIRDTARKVMGTSDVRVDQKLNKFMWSKGIRNLPRRVRVRMSRKRNEDEDAKEKMYTLSQLVQTTDFSELQTEPVRE